MSEPASGSSCGGGDGGGDDIKLATGKKPAMKEHRRSETASGSSGDATIKSQKVAEGDKAEAGKKAKMWTVTREYIDRLRKEKDAGPQIRSFDYLNDGTDPGADALRAIVAGAAAATAETEAEKARILEDYDTRGYAQVEVVEDPWSDKEMVRKLMAWKEKVQQLSS